MALAGTSGSLVISEDGTARLTGSFSGLDTDALVQAAVAAKRVPAVTLENKISDNDVKNEAYGEAVALLGTLESALSGLRSPPGVTGASSNIFEQKSVFLAADSATDATQLLGVSAENAAAAGIYQVQVQQIATAHKVAGGALADTTSALGVTETLTVALAGAEAEGTVDIDITADMTAGDVVSQINAQTDTTGVRASLVQIAADDFRVVLTAQATNREISLTGTNGDTADALGLSGDNGATFDNVLEVAQPAQITLDGLGTVIERDNNEISDVITGLTFDLFKAEPGTTVTVEVEADLTAVRQRIDDFVTAYNDVKSFLISQQEINSEGEIAETAILFGDSALRNLSLNLGLDLASSVDGVGDGELSTLRDLGIEMDADNFLTIDDGTLDAALVDKLDEVRALLEYGFTADSADIGIVSRTTALDLGEFTISVPAGAIDGTNLQVAGVDAFEVDGNVLRGIASTAYAGLTLAYARDTSDTGAAAQDITISTTLGIAERLFQTVNNSTDPVDGLITEARELLESQNADYEAEIAAIDERLVLYQAALIEKYARMEEVIAEGQAIADQLSATLNANR